MRISDWSSDVCSSDLVETGNDQRIPCSQHLERLRQLLAIALYATRGFVEHLRSPSGDKCRSLCIESLAVCCDAGIAINGHAQTITEMPFFMQISFAYPRAADLGGFPTYAKLVILDRKSTRLNSSH